MECMSEQERYENGKLSRELALGQLAVQPEVTTEIPVENLRGLYE